MISNNMGGMENVIRDLLDMTIEQSFYVDATSNSIKPDKETESKII